MRQPVFVASGRTDLFRRFCEVNKIEVGRHLCSYLSCMGLPRDITVWVVGGLCNVANDLAEAISMGQAHKGWRIREVEPNQVVTLG